MKRYREVEIYYGWTEGNANIWDTYVALLDPATKEEDYVAEAEKVMREEYPDMEYVFAGLYHVGDIVEI